ncbi:MAG: glycosyltransferase family 39 protein [Actinomycetota bacterium]|nr:glycosyltransferase family 39 protein [Actinomycetota bacterium]
MAITVETELASAAHDLSSPQAVPISLTQRADQLLRHAVPVATGLVAVGVILRFVATSQLWLDEALSVNIARLPLGQIPGALRHDGAPPLYYLLLHYWMLAVGDGTFAVRALSGLISVATLPVAWAAGMRLGGRRLAWASLLLLASSPFAINYATATRMYSLMILWSLLGFLALARALERPTSRRLAAVGVLTALTLYTHYWGIYVVAVTALLLLLRARREGFSVIRAATRGEVAVVATNQAASARPAATSAVGSGEVTRPASWSCLVAIGLGSLAFLPWLPSFVFQTFHTGTPWSNAAGLGDILTVLSQYAGGGPWGAALALSLFTLVLLGVFGESIDGHRVLVSLNVRRQARPVAFVFMGTLIVAVGCGAVAQAAFVGRYTAVVFPLFIVLAALGATVFANRRVLAAVLAWTTAAGLIVGIGANLSQRTEAGRVASVINKEASPNDLVLYCPDQLAPAVSRLITATVAQYTFPRGDSPQRINWVNYRQAIHATSVQQFAEQMLSAAAGHDIWFIQNPNYPGTEHKCTRLMDWLSTKRNSQVWVAPNAGTYSEYESLVRFPW